MAESVAAWDGTTLAPNSTGSGWTVGDIVGSDALDDGAVISDGDSTLWNARTTTIIAGANPTTLYSTTPVFRWASTAADAAAAVSGGKFWGFTVSRADAGAFTPDHLVLKAARGGSSTARGIAIYTSADGFTTPWVSQNIPTQRPNWTTYDIDLSTIGEVTSLEVRVYAWCGGTATATAEADDISLTATPASGTTPVSQSFSTSWDARATVSDVLSSSWSAFQGVAATLASAWHVSSVLGKNLALAWDARALTGDALAIAWHVSSVLGKNLALAWDVEEMGQVSQSFSSSWGARALVSHSLMSAWGARALTGDALALAWDARALTGDALALAWDALVGVDVGADFAWDTSGSVSQSLDISWDSEGGPVQDSDFAASLGPRTWAAEVQQRGWTAALGARRYGATMTT